MKPRVVIIGRGAVGENLAAALGDKVEIVQQFGRDMTHVVDDADYYIIAVPDDAIASVAAKLPAKRGVVMHTSGATPMSVLECANRRCAVLYPLQTFSRGVRVDMAAVHIFVEGDEEVETLARMLTPHIHHADSRDRLQLHLAGVFACNFVNCLLSIAEELMSERNLPFDTLLPLVQSTIDKLHHLSPTQAQTGPAARHDASTIARHEALLDGDRLEVYKLLTRLIWDKH